VDDKRCETGETLHQHSSVCIHGTSKSKTKTQVHSIIGKRSWLTTKGELRLPANNQRYAYCQAESSKKITARILGIQWHMGSKHLCLTGLSPEQEQQKCTAEERIQHQENSVPTHNLGSHATDNFARVT